MIRPNTQPGTHPVTKPVCGDYIDAPRRIPGVWCWLRNRVIITSAKVSTWIDMSGNGRDASQSDPSLRPLFVPGPIPYLDCGPAGATTQLNLPSMASLTSGERFCVIAQHSVPVGSGGAVEALGGVNDATFVPYSNASVYDTFATSARKNNIFTLTPTQNAPYIYSSAGSAGYWQAWLNGVSKYNTGTNVVAFSASPFLFKHPSNSNTFYGAAYEWIIFSRVLETAERASVVQYLKSRYGIS